MATKTFLKSTLTISLFLVVLAFSSTADAIIIDGDIGLPLQWQKTFGGSDYDMGYSVQQTTDGGYIIAGWTDSFGEGDRDVYLVKTHPNGEVQWERTFGGDKNDYGYSVLQTSDGGYVIVGRTHSFAVEGWYGRNYPDVYLIKTDSSGTLVWQKSFGGKNPEEACSVKQTKDGGYIMAGEILHTGPFDRRPHRDVYLIKTDPNGNQQWEQELGGLFGDFGRSVDQTTDGGYIITGYTSSFNPTIYYDVYLVRTDSQGNLLWQKTFGGDNSDVGWSVQQTTDGGYIIAGGTDSFGAGKFDVYLIKGDLYGNIQWEKTFGGSQYDRAFSVRQETNGGYIIAGWTDSVDVGRPDVYVVSTDSNGNLQWQKTFGGSGMDAAYSVQQTADGGYIIAGLTDSFGAGSSDVYLIKLGPKVIFVDHAANGANDGSSWADAYNYLQDALADANASTKPVEIRVAQGIYIPDEDTLHPDGTSDREATFQLINNVTLKGGYAGFGATSPDERDIERYKCILSGDLNGDDVAVNDPCDLLTEPRRAENCYHVVSAVGTDITAVLDGFTITGGNADHPISWPEDHRSYGGGLYIEKWRHATVLNCTFTNNSGRMGGAICYDHGKPVINDCCFVANAANEKGGGISDGWSSKAAVTNCTFNNNRSHFGGGMFTSGSETILTQCTFNANRAYHGGGMYNEISDPVANSCLFKGNWARYGGAIYNEEESEPIFVNCTFSGNAAPYDPYNETGGDGGAINHWGGSRSNLTNCILWGDSPDEISGGRNLVSYCCIQGWSADIGGVGNIDADPCFASPGYWADFSDPNTIIEPNEPNAVWVDGDYHLLPSSPCIDAGDPNYLPEPNETDLDGEPRVLDGDNDGIPVVDMGAYEYWFTISAEARIVPRTINLASKGKWITCYIWLPDEYDIADIDPGSVLLERQIKAEQFSVDEQAQVATARFIREDVQAVLSIGDIELSIKGRLKDGTFFTSADTVKVIKKAGKK